MTRLAMSSRPEQARQAALSLVPLVSFVSATNPQWLATLDALRNQLTDDGLVRNRGFDGLEGSKGAFNACLWHVECLARAGRVEQATSSSKGFSAMPTWRP